MSKDGKWTLEDAANYVNLGPAGDDDEFIGEIKWSGAMGDQIEEMRTMTNRLKMLCDGLDYTLGAPEFANDESREYWQKADIALAGMRLLPYLLEDLIAYINSDREGIRESYGDMSWEEIKSYLLNQISEKLKLCEALGHE